MITVDRTSTVLVHVQLLKQLRYLIAIGRFKIDEVLPSTRTLAEQTGVSFHTIRKAYQQLEREGLVEGRRGRGYRVVQRAPIEMSERMEQGASIVADSLQKLVGLGLSEQEIEYLFQEQFDLVASLRQSTKVVFAAPFKELASICAQQMSMALQLQVQSAAWDELPLHQDADHVTTRFADLRRVMELLPRADVMGVVVSFTPSTLEHIARLLSHETLGLVTRYADAIEPLTRDLRAQTGFAGQAIAASIEAGSQQLQSVAQHADFIVYTPDCQRQLLRILPPEQKHGAITPMLSKDSIERLRQTVPR